MDTLHNDAGFEDILRRTAEIIQARAQAAQEVRARQEHYWSNRLTLAAIVTGVIIAAAVTFATGYLALTSDTPGIWIHRLMALTVLQSLLIAAAVTTLKPLLENGSLSVRVAAPEAQNLGSSQAARARAEQPIQPPPPLPRKPAIGGTLAGREYLQHLDGTVEIDTLLGRRRFVSIEAAKEFVGS